jgi:hypothetical protein
MQDGKGLLLSGFYRNIEGGLYMNLIDTLKGSLLDGFYPRGGI